MSTHLFQRSCRQIMVRVGRGVIFLSGIAAGELLLSSK